MDDIRGQRCEELVQNLELTLGEADGPLPLLPRDAPDFCDRHVAAAQHDHLALTAPVSFGLVCFRHRSGNEATNALLDAINSAPNVYLTGSSLGSERFIRVSVGSTWTTADDVDRLWSIIDRAASKKENA